MFLCDSRGMPMRNVQQMLFTGGGNAIQYSLFAPTWPLNEDGWGCLN